MYYFLSVLAGFLISVMILFNGTLTAHYGVYVATVIIHIVGLCLIFAILLTKKQPLLIKKRLPLLLYSGGAIGVATTVFNNVAFGKISISAILALGLLGQSVSSLVIDQFGLLDMPKLAFRPNKLLGISLITVGIVIMLVA